MPPPTNPTQVPTIQSAYASPKPEGYPMDELEQRVEVLSEHVALLEGVINVLLQEAERGRLQESAASIRAALPQVDE